LANQPKCQVLDCFTLEDGTDRLSRNVGIKYKSTLCTIPEEQISKLHRGGSSFSFCCFVQTMAAFCLFTQCIVLVLLNFLVIVCVKYVCNCKCLVVSFLLHSKWQVFITGR